MTTELPEEPDIEFIQGVHISPFELFRMLTDGRSVDLVDVRRTSRGSSLLGAVSHEDVGQPRAGVDRVYFDDEGGHALEYAIEMRRAGHLRCRALYGGLALYELAMDPQVVGPENHLVGRAQSSRLIK